MVICLDIHNVKHAAQGYLNVLVVYTSYTMAKILHEINTLIHEHQKTKFWTISLRQLKWNAKTWFSKARNLSTIALGSFIWMTGLSKYTGTSWHSWAPLECGLRLRPGLPQESLSRERPGPQHPTWAGDQIHSAVETWQDCWYTPGRSWNVESLWYQRWRSPADPWPNQEYHPLREIRTEWEENITGSHWARQCQSLNYYTGSWRLQKNKQAPPCVGCW